MNYEHVISDELFNEAQAAFAVNEHWIAFNTIPYFLERGDMYFFKDRDEAHEFSENNLSEYDNYAVMHVRSVDELLRQIPYGQRLEQQLFNSTNLSIMNEQNLSYLKDNLKYLGFGEKQNETLEQHLKEGKDSFQLTFNADVNKKPFEATLQFRKSDSSDMYFFNSYQASIERSNKEKVEQTFYLNKGKGVTAKEAYNLLEGRAVHKELSNKAGEPYKAWIQLDFDNKDKHDNNEVKQYHENYGYNLKDAVSKFSIAELNDPEKEKSLLQSLQKGNIQSVTIEKDGAAHKMFIEANPQYKTVNLYDGQMKRVQKESLEQYHSITPSKDAVVKQEQQQEIKPEIKHEKETVKKGKTQKDDSLLPKKRTRQKKGLGLN
ncbi:MAG: hypothetical protein ABI675_22515 [Chitinophagaceae bacterium]